MDGRRQRIGHESPFHTRIPRTLRWVWPWTLAAFVLAASTGAAMRFGMVVGWPSNLAFDHVRHAHSHLMYFGWVTPALMALIAAAVARRGTPMRGMRALLAVTVVAAFASYPAFLTSGYGTSAWLGVELPWSMMVAALNGLAWLAFMVQYVWASQRKTPSASVPTHAVGAWLDAAVFLLFLSLVGIAGLAGTAMGGLAEPRITAAWVDLFLAWFGEGWFTAGVVAIAVWALETDDAGPSAWLGHAALVFLTGTVASDLAAFARGVGAALLGGTWVDPDSVTVLLIGSAGHVLAGAALAAVAFALLMRRPGRRAVSALWMPALAFLAAKGIVEIGFAAPAVRDAILQANLRVLMLHAFLLGGISLALLAAFGADRSAPRASWAFAAGVVVLLAGLVPLTGLFPAEWRGLWSLHVAAWTSLGPVVAALALLLRTMAKAPAGQPQ